MSGGLNRFSSGPTKNILPPQELLDDLCSRFERILFLVEYANWFYEDNSVEKNPSLKSLTLKEFSSLCILQELQECGSLNSCIFVS